MEMEDKSRHQKRDRGKQDNNISEHQDKLPSVKCLSSSESSFNAVTDEFLLASVRCSPDPSFAIDTDGVIRIWNREMEKLTGVRADYVVGKKEHELGSWFYKKSMPCAASLLLRPDPSAESRYEYFVRTEDSATAILTYQRQGHAKRFWIRVKTLRNDEGHVIGAIETIRDITVEDEIVNLPSVKDEWLREMFANISSGVAIYDAVNGGSDFIIREFNPAAEKSTGYKRSEVLGRFVTEVFSGIKEFGLLDVFKRVWITGKPERKPASLYSDEKNRSG